MNINALCQVASLLNAESYHETDLLAAAHKQKDQITKLSCEVAAAKKHEQDVIEGLTLKGQSLIKQKHIVTQVADMMRCGAITPTEVIARMAEIK